MQRVRNPQLRLLSDPVILKIIDEAHDVLCRVGVLVENDDALRLLSDYGLTIDGSKRIVKMTPDIIDRALKSVPSKIELFDRDGQRLMDLSDQNVHFDPGSAALHIWDYNTQKPRKAETKDVVDFVKLVEQLPNYAAQSTGLIASDVPDEIADLYRLYIGLLLGRKPVVTGTFHVNNFRIMRDMLIAVRGSDQALREKPLAIFDCCPSPPLKWSNLTCHDLMECARYGIPAELVSMPLTGATAPVTLLGALVQLTAENLSGVIIHQLTNPGAPILFGGSPAVFDMRKGTTPMGAIGTMMIDCSYAQIGRQLGMPTHAYMALSDAKQLDAQAGFETGMGAVLAAIAGINVVSGPGMLDFESCQCLEKLVVDHEICGMALRIKNGILAHHEVFSAELYGDIYDGEYFLTSPETLNLYKKEFYFPDDVIDRKNLQEWLADGEIPLLKRTHDKVISHLSAYEAKPLPVACRNELENIVKKSANNAGMDRLPEIK